MSRIQSDVRFDEFKQALGHVDKGAAAEPTKRNKPMEIAMGQVKTLDVAGQRTSNQLVQLIRKLRWIGRDDEAERVLKQLTRCRFRPTETVIAGPWATD
jgi:hypothetical protein